MVYEIGFTLFYHINCWVMIVLNIFKMDLFLDFPWFSCLDSAQWLPVNVISASPMVLICFTCFSCVHGSVVFSGYLHHDKKWDNSRNPKDTKNKSPNKSHALNSGPLFTINQNNIWKRDPCLFQCFFSVPGDPTWGTRSGQSRLHFFLLRGSLV